MRLSPATPLLMTKHGTPLAFDVIDADNPSAGIIGRATFSRWDFNRGVVTYVIEIRQGERRLIGTLPLKHKPNLQPNFNQ